MRCRSRNSCHAILPDRWCDTGVFDLSQTHTPSLTEQLQRGFHGLRFEGELETAYRRDQFHDRLRYLRVNLAILAAICLLVVQVDRVVLPVISRIVPDLARNGIMLPLLLLGLGVTFLRRADVWYPRYIAVAMAVALAAMSWVSLSAWFAGEPRLFGRLLLAMTAVYFVLGLAFRPAIAVNALALAIYAAIASAKGMPANDLALYLLTLAIANVICVAGAYNLEHARRTAWLEGQRLAETALQDGLTGIHNRRRFDEHLQRTWSQCARERKPLALLFADLDHFKRYNDCYGHQAGDEALKAVAGVLSGFARRPLDLAARYGGEEFAVILFDARREHALQIGDEVLEAVRRLSIPHRESGVATVLTISIGVACVQPVDRRSWAGLIQLADQALYAAKDGGRNRAHLLEQEYDHMQTGYFHRKVEAKAPQ
jgi:diguanylate cyclase (GGDEF)-like protein